MKYEICLITDALYYDLFNIYAYCLAYSTNDMTN